MMRPFALILAGLLGLGILTYLCGSHHGPHFAADLSGKTKAALGAAGIAPVDVAGEGQVITLRGQVATEALKTRAGEEAYKIDGVAKVNNLLTIAPTPATAPPAMSATQRVQAVNCQQAFNRMLQAEKIRFETGKAAINRASHKLLDRLAAAAGKCTGARIQVEGHTDSRGARAMNMKLSRSRAEAVVKYLESKGVAPSRLTAEGFGPDKPVASNKTAAGLERNRRTEFKVRGLQ